MEIVFMLVVLMTLFWIGFVITGAILKAICWLFLAVPVALFLWFCGIAFCCTLILIPVGLRLFWSGFRILTCV